MYHRSSVIRSFVISAITYILFLVGIYYFSQKHTIPSEYEDEALIFLIFLCSTSFAVVLYQSLRIFDTAHALAQDLTENILTYSRELFSELYRNSPVPYVVIDEEGNVETINLATARLFHVKKNALDTLNIFSFFDSENTHKGALIPEYFRQGKFINDMEIRVRRPDGASRWVMLSLFSFTDTKRQKKGLLTLVDITKQKIIDKAKTEFVLLASHQLRTPISVMKWNIELLLMAGKNTLSKLEESYIEKITLAVRRMDTLVGDFLSVSKFELGTLTSEIGSVDSEKFFKNIYDEHLSMAEKREVRVVFETESVEDTFQSDSHLLHMIVSNLLSNAIKYTLPTGSVILHASTNTDQLIIVVRDSGIGIPEEEQEMLFSKMFRATNARTQVTDGTGLGLYIAKEAAQVLGGKISCVSKVGEGSIFTVTLPK